MRELHIHNLVLKLDGYGDDAVEEARQAVAAINVEIQRFNSSPLLDFDLRGSADIEAEYLKGPEGAELPCDLGGMQPDS